jgi:intracellular sulfur oxidation DsrE/DsrF family protein
VELTMRMILLNCSLLTLVAVPATAEEPLPQFPRIAGFGGVFTVPDAAEPPRRGAEIVFDITADSKSDEVNKGLEAVARYLNLNAQAGLSPNDAKLALVLHGGATKAALNDAAYGKHSADAKNPNLKLIRELKSCGVEVFVCGQSLARNRFAADEVAAELTVAVSALTVNVNKQRDGYAYLAIH